MVYVGSICKFSVETGFRILENCLQQIISFRHMDQKRGCFLIQITQLKAVRLTGGLAFRYPSNTRKDLSSRFLMLPSS